MRNWVKRLKRLLRTSTGKRRAFARAAREFADEHPGSFILLADPETDLIYSSYRGIEAGVQLKQPGGARMHVVANALDYSKVEKSIDQFLGVVDSFLYNIAKESDNRRRTNLTTTPVEFIEGAVEKTPEGIKSPIQRVH